ncbi:MAG: hypothetical protein COB67_10690 [SAR324 cluster bacterium]|uniref:histidine kinase n=1 Tax=SAR324 cluster bacterium TaxID=2024889 RepID=A0A2A4SVB7_9DELT|nr:MAG: hypothetical protein COB67_10690 [SAR324 cluster bacterium]
MEQKQLKLSMKQKNKVLLVDDDTINLKMMQLALEKNYQTRQARSGEEALQVMQEFTPDVILLDISMPGMDGYEVCRQVRQDKRHCFTKIILVSAREGVHERLKGYGVGADDYITKPFVNRELEAKVQVFLRLKRTEEVDQLKGDVLKLFSHETRTPLNGILGAASLLGEDRSLDEDQQTLVNLIENCGKQLFDLVQKTTLLCDLKSGQPLNKSEQPLAMHLQELITSFERIALEKQVKLCLMESLPPTSIDADWTILVQTLHYITDNAIKYSNAKGEVQFSLEQTENSLVLKITDQGIGIKEEWMGKIFDEFAINDVKHHQKGQGLSLAIAKYVMEAHQGSIQVESVYTQGTTVTLIFPLSA